MYTSAEASMAAERVEAQHSHQALQPPSIQGRVYPPLTPPTAPAQHLVRDPELLTPLTVSTLPCEYSIFHIMGLSGD